MNTDQTPQNSLAIAPSKGLVVDASCTAFNGTIKRDGYFHGIIEWQVLGLKSRTVLVKSKVYDQGTINIAEYCAIADALKFLHDHGDTTSPVYSDSKLTIAWVNGGYTSTNLPLNHLTEPALTAMRARHEWLLELRPPNPVLWWAKYKWGENPADFGRKGQPAPIEPTNITPPPDPPGPLINWNNTLQTLTPELHAEVNAEMQRFYRDDLRTHSSAKDRGADPNQPWWWSHHHRPGTPCVFPVCNCTADTHLPTPPLVNAM